MNRIRLLLSTPFRGARGVYNRFSRTQRIFLLIGLVILIGGAAVGFVMLRDNEPEIDLVNMDGIIYKLRGLSLETDKLTAALTEAHSLLRQKVGLPVFMGEVVIVFDPNETLRKQETRVEAFLCDEWVGDRKARVGSRTCSRQLAIRYYLSTIPSSCDRGHGSGSIRSFIVGEEKMKN